MADQIFQASVDTDLRPACYDDFHCLAANCRFSCCKGWRVTFDKKDYLSLKRLEGSPELRRRMENTVCRIRKDPPAGDYGEFDMHTGVCPLLREDGLCHLQAEKGPGALPRVCRIFPRAEAYSYGHLERSLSPACEGVLELLWNLPEGVDFRSDSLEKEARKVLTLTGDLSLRPFYLPIREWCVDTLQDRSAPLPRRILRMGLGLRELAEGKRDPAAWLAWARALGAQEDLSLPEGALLMFLSSCCRTLLHLSDQSGDFADVVLELLRGLGVDLSDIHRAVIPMGPYLAARERYEEVFRDRAYFLENLMVSVLFYLHLPFLSSREELWKGYVNFCNLYAVYRFLAVMSCREGVEDNKAELFRLTVFASQKLLHNGLCQSQLRDEFFQNESATLAHMAILLCG